VQSARSRAGSPAVLRVLSYGRAAAGVRPILVRRFARERAPFVQHRHSQAPHAGAKADMTDASCPPPPSRATLALGVGCRRGVTVEQIESAVAAALSGLRLDNVKRIATIASKASEPALLAFATRHGIALVTFSIEAIERFLDEHDGLDRSPLVHAHAGTRGVCEPCALLAVPGGRLVAAKQAYGDVTVAIAAAPE
jgi:cobalt-precorrin 5A hydrolase